MPKPIPRKRYWNNTTVLPVIGMPSAAAYVDRRPGLRQPLVRVPRATAAVRRRHGAADAATALPERHGHRQLFAEEFHVGKQNAAAREHIFGVHTHMTPQHLPHIIVVADVPPTLACNL